jgi:hypothetical protein
MFIFVASCAAIGQETADDLATLRWVQRQSDSIQQVLIPAIKLSDRFEVHSRLLRANEMFSAVALVAPYCSQARISAIEGMSKTDWINNLRNATDQGSMIMRTTEALAQARLMYAGASACIEELNPQTKQVCLLQNTLHTDAKFAALDLEDGIASKDFHMLTQKVEHALALIAQMQSITANCAVCDEVKTLIDTSNRQTKEILIAANWLEINQLANQAIQNLKLIAASTCTP